MDPQLDSVPDFPASPPPQPQPPPRRRPRRRRQQRRQRPQLLPPPRRRPVRMGACMGRCIADKSSCLKRWRSTDEHETELMTDEEDENNTQRRKKKESKLIFRIIKFKRKNRKQFLEKFLERQDLNYSRLSSAPTAELTDIQLQSLDAQTLLVAAAKDIATTNSFAPVAAASSRTSSSLDLEWEHEYGQQAHHTNRALSRSWLFIDGAAADGADDDFNKPLFNSPPSDDNGAVTCLLPKDSARRSSNTADGPVGQVMAKSNPSQQANFTRTSSRTSWSHISTPESLEWDIDEEQRNQMHLEDDNLDHETLELLHQIEMLKNKVLHETGDGLDGMEFPSNGESGDS